MASYFSRGQQNSLTFSHLLKGTTHTHTEVWHVAHGYGQLGEAEGSEQGVPSLVKYIQVSSMSLTCTPEDVTDTLLGRTRTCIHLLSSSVKPCGAEAPGQAPSRQHLYGNRPEQSEHCPRRAQIGVQ